VNKGHSVAASPTGLGIRVLSTLGELERARDSWESLWSRCTNRSPFLCFDWVYAWAQTCGVGHRLHILVMERGKEVVAIVPLVIVRHPLGPVSLSALETAAGDSRNMIALVGPGNEQAAARAFADYLRGSTLEGVTCLWLRLVMPGSPFFRELHLQMASRGGIGWRVRSSSAAPYILLPRDRDNRWPGLSSKRRSRLKTMEKRLEAGHQVSFQDCHDEQVAPAMDELYALHQQRWNAAGIDGMFGNPQVRRFHTLAARWLDQRGLGRVNRMTIDGEAVSSHFVLVLDGVLYLLRSGRTLAYQEYSIGHLHDLFLFREAVKAGLAEVDFLRGAEPYKFYWTRNQRAYVDVVATLGKGCGTLPAPCVAVLLRVAEFTRHRHTARELAAIIGVKWRQARELRRMKRSRKWFRNGPGAAAEF